MFYDDEARRFNFISGLLLGAVLGTGLALIAAPEERRKRMRKMRQRGSALKNAIERGGKMAVPDRDMRKKQMRDFRKAIRHAMR